MLNEFIAYLLEQVANHSIYVWGAQGQKAPTVCEAWIRRREQDTGGEKFNGRYMTYADIAVDYWKRQVAAGYGDVLRAFDCSGLVVFWLLDHKLIKHDMTANGLHSICDPATEPRAGYWVFKVSNGRATHIGVLVDGKTVVEARGRAYGVVRREYKPDQWQAIGKPRVFDFGPEPSPEPPAPTEKLVKVIGGSVRVRDGNGAGNVQIGTAHNGKWYKEHGINKQADTFPLLRQCEEYPYWYAIEYKGQIGYITSLPRYTEVIEK